MPEDCPTCNQPIYNVQGAIAEMGKVASQRDRYKAALIKIASQRSLDWPLDIAREALRGEGK